MSHTFYIVAGCNGAGKTTAFKYQLSRNTHISDADFINPDEVAHELCPQDVDRAQYQAGRACLERFPMMLETGEDFCMETTLASRTF